MSRALTLDAPRNVDHSLFPREAIRLGKFSAQPALTPRRLIAPLAAVSAAGAGLLAYAHYIEPKWLDIQHLELTLPRLDPEFDGYRIVQFSDLHMELWQDWAMLEEIVAQTNAFEPDLIALTGDYVHRRVDGVADRLSQTLSRLRAKDAALAIMGNHDYWQDGNAVRRMLARANLIDISNSVHTIRRGNAALHIAGIDSVVEMRSRLDLVVESLTEPGAAILLAHEPDIAYVTASTGCFDLQLSGHSHGGQVRVPLLMNLVLPAFARRFVVGLNRINGMYVYTNRGVGMSGMRLRFNCRPELTVFTLRANGRRRSRPNGNERSALA